jgi:hypothetical protein
VTAKRRSRIADRLQDGIVVALVIAAVGFAATASRADLDDPWGTVSVVKAPPTVCATVDAAHRSHCLRASAAISLRR